MRSKFFRRLTAILLAVLLAGAAIVPASAAVTDVSPGHWVYPALQHCLKTGYVDNTRDWGTNQAAPRKAVVYALYQMDGGSWYNGSAIVPIDMALDIRYWNTTYLLAAGWGKETGVVTGTKSHPNGNWEFSPDRTVTREQMVTFLYRYAKYTGKDLAGNNPAFLNRFRDGSKTSPWAREAMAWAINKGLTNGVNNYTLNPRGNLTKAQLTQFLYNYDKIIAGVPVATPTPQSTATPRPTATPTPWSTMTPRPTATPTPWSTVTPRPTATPTP